MNDQSQFRAPARGRAEPLTHRPARGSGDSPHGLQRRRSGGPALVPFAHRRRGPGGLRGRRRQSARAAGLGRQAPQRDDGLAPGHGARRRSPGRRAGRAGGAGGVAHHQGGGREAPPPPGGGGLHRRGGPFRRPVRFPGHCRAAHARDHSQCPGSGRRALTEAMAAWGMDSNAALFARRAPESIHAYLELHIEQGPVLDRNHVAIGVVDAITGLFKWDVRLMGQTNHAGTTPMDMRVDSFQGLAEFAGEITRILEEHGSPHSRATIGRVELKPGAANTVPGRDLFLAGCARYRRGNAQEPGGCLSPYALLPGAPPRPDVRVRCALGDSAHALRSGAGTVAHGDRRASGARTPAHAQRRRPRCPDHGLGDAHRHDLRAQHRGQEPLGLRMDALGRHRERRQPGAACDPSTGRRGCGHDHREQEAKRKKA
jgi:hypothetical protein